MVIELGNVQERFAEIVWKNEPVKSGDLVSICNSELNWKKSTTFTVLKKLCEKGLFVNENGIVTSLVSREEYYSSKSEQLLDAYCDGSLPSFIAAFVQKKELTAKEIDEIKKIIDSIER